MGSPSCERDGQFQALTDVLLGVSPEIFRPFDIFRAQYPSAGIKIEVDILVPKRKTAAISSHPVIVRIHGGFLITGSSLFPAWFSKWILDYAEENNAIIVSPNYRLLPEVKGHDIIQDMASFWSWLGDGGVKRYLNSIGRPDISLKQSRLLLAGESAGGYLALQSVMSGFVRPKGIIVLYPMVDMTSSHYTKKYPKPIVGVSNYDEETVEEFLSSTLGAAPITEADPPSRLAAAIAAVQNGRFLDLFGHDEDFFFLEHLQKRAPLAQESGMPFFPPIFLLHGEDDTAVPVEGSIKLLRLLRQADPAAKIHAAIRPGDHGFDFKASTEESWLRAGLEFISAAWIESQHHI